MITHLRDVKSTSRVALLRMLDPGAATPAMRAWAVINLLKKARLNPQSYTAEEALSWAMSQKKARTP